MKKRLTEKLVFVVFAIIGIGLIIGGIFSIKNSKEFMENAIETYAIITDIQTSRDSDGDIDHDVFVEFEVNGKKYDGELDSYTSGMHEGGTTLIYYNPNNPNDFRSSFSKFGGVILIVLGSIFSAVGIIPIFVKNMKKSTNKKLMETGQKIYAEFDQVIINENYTVNGVHPYKILCHAKEYENIDFKSENIWKNPKNIIEERNITIFEVYINPENPSKYYMPLEEIKEYL